MREFTTQGGATVSIDFAGFKAASILKRTLEKELLKVRLEFNKTDRKTIENFKGLDIENIFTPELINSLKNILFAIDSSEEVEKAIFGCLIRCTYNGVKITCETFDNVDAVGDYLEIVLNCIKENLTPFFKNQASQLSNLQILQKLNTQESK